MMLLVFGRRLLLALLQNLIAKVLLLYFPIKQRFQDVKFHQVSSKPHFGDEVSC